MNHEDVYFQFWAWFQQIVFLLLISKFIALQNTYSLVFSKFYLRTILWSVWWENLLRTGLETISV